MSPSQLLFPHNFSSLPSLPLFFASSHLFTPGAPLPLHLPPSYRSLHFRLKTFPNQCKKDNTQTFHSSPSLLPGVRRLHTWMTMISQPKCHRSRAHARTHTRTHVRSRCTFLILPLRTCFIRRLLLERRGLSCQDLTCLPEDKAITGGGAGDGAFEQKHTATRPDALACAASPERCGKIGKYSCDFFFC